MFRYQLDISTSKAFQFGGPDAFVWRRPAVGSSVHLSVVGARRRGRSGVNPGADRGELAQVESVLL